MYVQFVEGVPHTSDQKCTLISREVRFIARTAPLPSLRLL